MTTVEDVFSLYERNSNYYHNCLLQCKPCNNNWDNKCFCYLSSIVKPVVIGDTTTKCNIYKKCYIKIGTECPICYEDITNKNNAFLTSCGHAFHKSCISKLNEFTMLYKCPVCRRSLGQYEEFKRYDITNNLDRLENFWLTKDIIPRQICIKKHILGLNKNCKYCRKYRNEGIDFF